MVHITNSLLDDTSEKAKQAQRLRMNYNFHRELSDTLQRMLNAMEPTTYVQPHKHKDPDKREIFVILRGRVVVIEFDDNGEIIDYLVLDKNMGNYGVEIAPGKWHSIISLESGSVVYEVKDGPYHKIDDKNFADWAPREGEEGTLEFNQKILQQLNLVTT